LSKWAIQIDRQKDRQVDRQTDRQTHRQTGRHTSSHIDRLTCIQIDIQADGQTER